MEITVLSIWLLVLTTFCLLFSAVIVLPTGGLLYHKFDNRYEPGDHCLPLRDASLLWIGLLTALGMALAPALSNVTLLSGGGFFAGLYFCFWGIFLFYETRTPVATELTADSES